MAAACFLLPVLASLPKKQLSGHWTAAIQQALEKAKEWGVEASATHLDDVSLTMVFFWLACSHGKNGPNIS